MVGCYLWQKIASKLRRRITQGQWSKGTLIPTEMELCDMYGVSRATIRKALSELTKSGYVQAKQRIGTRVIYDAAGSTFYTELGGIRAIDEYGNAFPRQVLETQYIEAGEIESRELGLTQGRNYLVFRNVRASPQKLTEAVVYTHVYVEAGLRGIVEKAKANPDELIITLVEQILGRTCASIRQTVSARPMKADAAEIFGLEPGIPSLRIVRNYYDALGANMVVSDSCHPGARYAFTFTANRKNSR